MISATPYVTANFEAMPLLTITRWRLRVLFSLRHNSYHSPHSELTLTDFRPRAHFDASIDHILLSLATILCHIAAFHGEQKEEEITFTMLISDDAIGYLPAAVMYVAMPLAIR